MPAMAAKPREFVDPGPIDAVLEPAGPAAFPGEGAVAQDGLAVAGVQQAQAEALRPERPQRLFPQEGGHVVEQDRALADGVDAVFAAGPG